jgi:DNA polymerase-3 subunit delta'
MAFRDVYGHRRALGLLSRALAQRTLPPSLLFVGPEGVGKRRIALAVAQALNCLSPRLDQMSRPDSHGTIVALPTDACGECAACRRIARLVHPDVVWLAPVEDKATVSIEQIRALNEQVGYRPFEARSRVVVVDDAADVLPPVSQNALLKTLEEPPSGTVFVLVAAQPEGLLATVRSRCPSVRFGPLPAADVAACLENNHGVGPADARAQAAVSDGSIGVALGAAAVAGARAGVQRVLAAVAGARDPRGRLDVAREIVGKASKGSGLGERDSLAVHLRLLHGLLRDLGILSTRADAGALASADLEPALQRLAPAFDRARLVRAFTAVDRALEALERNAQPKIVADWLVLQL